MLVGHCNLFVVYHIYRRYVNGLRMGVFLTLVVLEPRNAGHPATNPTRSLEGADGEYDLPWTLRGSRDNAILEAGTRL